MRKLTGNKRAVSPVLSTILLILIVAIGMSVAFGFFVNYVSDYQAGRGASVLELISIEDVWFKADRATIDVWLYNYGKVEVKISTLYIDGHSVTLNNVNVPIGAHKDLSVQTVWDYDVVYHLKFVTERGTVFEGNFASPST
jgi:FlaG/FlaF family flagellin (archaellin)